MSALHHARQKHTSEVRPLNATDYKCQRKTSFAILVQVLLTCKGQTDSVFCMILALCLTSSDMTSGQRVNKISSKRT